MRFIALYLLFFLTAATQADIYQSNDQQGHPSYSDQPSDDSKVITLTPTNTIKAVEPIPYRATTPAQIPAAIYEHLRIESPRNDSLIGNGLYPFNVTLSLQPALKSGHSIVLFIDGKVQSKGQLLSRQVASIERGKHQLEAKVVDSNGKTLITSPVITLSALRPVKKR